MASDDATCQYRVVLKTDAVEWASTLLAEREDCLGTELVDEEVASRTDVPEPTREAGTVVAYFERTRPEAAPEIRSEVAAMLQQLEDTEWEIAECARYTDDSWKETWKEYFEPLRLSEQVGVGPPWRADDIPEPADGTSLIVEPGMAFGTGQHETTQLTARMLDERLDRRGSGVSVLDVGCGSGILSMVAAELGAARVRGIDIEGDAIAAARENLERNGLEGRAEFSTTPLEELEASYDLVVANILAPVLLELRDELFAHVAEDGELLVSGIALEREESFRDAFLPRDWRVAERRQLGEWLGYACRRDDDSNRDS